MNSIHAKMLAGLLKEMRTECGDYYPEEVWPEIHQSVALPYVELVIPRKAGGRWEIFLTRRPANDPHWPEMWHLPGGLWRTHESEIEACNSVAQRELGITVSHVHEIMTYKWTTHPYGNPISHVCICQTEDKLTKTADQDYFEEPPKDFISEQITFFTNALAYLAR